MSESLTLWQSLENYLRIDCENDIFSDDQWYNSGHPTKNFSPPPNDFISKYSTCKTRILYKDEKIWLIRYAFYIQDEILFKNLFDYLSNM